tara:strand:- start:248 stop:853 length:606 start_codon:yes stop_codon:yes gene_type:complete
MHDAAYQTTFKKPQQEKIEKYIELAIEFNKTHNIFVRKNRQEILDKDIVDCSPLVKLIEPNKSIADLGSGGGFPGLLLSITKPESKITLIESSQKKCYFLKSAIHTLKLKNTEVINKTLTEKNDIGVFDIITARAFAPIEKIMNLTKNNTHRQTIYYLLKGKDKKTKEELKVINQKKHKCEIINLNNKNFDRSLVVIKQNE